MDTKKEAVCQTNTAGNNVGQVIAKWDRCAHLCFVDLCEQEIEKGNRFGTGLRTRSWKNIARRFNRAMGRNYTGNQMKTRWNTMRADWKLFKELIKGEKGLKWDETKNTIAVDSKWWDEKIKVNKKFRRFRNKDLSSIWFHYDKLFSIVKGNVGHEDEGSSNVNCGKNAEKFNRKRGVDNAKFSARKKLDSLVEEVSKFVRAVVDRVKSFGDVYDEDDDDADELKRDAYVAAVLLMAVVQLKLKMDNNEDDDDDDDKGSED